MTTEKNSSKKNEKLLHEIIQKSLRKIRDSEPSRNKKELKKEIRELIIDSWKGS